MPKFPIDPDTGKPYVVGIITNGTGGSLVFGEAGSKATGYDETDKVAVPVQRVRGNFQYELDWKSLNFQLTPYPSMYGLLPRWYVEDPDGFEQTSFYFSGATMFGG